jgi:leucyl-tRNA synthetase
MTRTSRPTAGAVPPYTPRAFEAGRQQEWEQAGLFAAEEDPTRPKFYCLEFFPYPSGDGLSVGHCRNYIPTDVISRFMRMRGYTVLHPMGWDAFGEPTENAAIQRRESPRALTDRFTATYKRQMRMVGLSYDWTREIDSSRPDYYRWTQWFFLLLYRRGLAYRATQWQWWCAVCQTTMSESEVSERDGERFCWRDHPGVTRRRIPAWLFRITAYADRLLADLRDLDWPEETRRMQEHWIGRSEGAEVVFRSERGDPLPAFTTRPDTVFGITFLALAPEQELVERLTTPEHRDEVEAYVQRAARTGEIERRSTAREQSGVFTGSFAVNPVNGARVPVYVADYVLPGHGTGIVMGVPAHDRRDFEFALAAGLPVLPVIAPADGEARSYLRHGTFAPRLGEELRAAGLSYTERGGGLLVTLPERDRARYVDRVRRHLAPDSWTEVIGAGWQFVFGDGAVLEVATLADERRVLDRCRALAPAVRARRTVAELLWSVPFYRDLLCHDAHGTMINSGPLTGTPGDAAEARTIAWLAERGFGRHRVSYRMHDWVISRQKYWGTPIPIVFCARCGEVSVPEEQLPVTLPPLEDISPPGDGRSALARAAAWVQTTCPTCGGPAARETDTLGGFACSSWYYLRFTSPHETGRPFDPERMRFWMPVDLYVGGAEHAVMHLLYARFWYKVMGDAGLGVPGSEPFPRLRHQGQVLAADRQRMSKSRGNVITPDEIVERFGADSLRVYELFMAPFEHTTRWSEEGISGCHRFLRRVWELVLGTHADAAGERFAAPDEALARLLHQTIRRTTRDIERFRFNTMVAGLMEFTHALVERRRGGRWRTRPFQEAVATLPVLLAPVAPFMAEELWQRTGHAGSVHTRPWPTWDEELARAPTATIVVQVNGRVRDRFAVPAGTAEDEVKRQALARPRVRRLVPHPGGARVISVPGRLVNVVTQ